MLPKSCDDCHKQNPRGVRQAWMCPYETPNASCRTPVIPPAYSGQPLTVCPGYTTSLPETIEAARGWRHWDRADIRAFTGGEWPTTALTLAIETFDDAVAKHQKWCADNPVKTD